MDSRFVMSLECMWYQWPDGRQRYVCRSSAGVPLVLTPATTQYDLRGLQVPAATCPLPA